MKTTDRPALVAQAEALDAEYARLNAQLNDLNAKVGDVGRARSRAWDAVDGITRVPRKAATMSEMMALHDFGN